MIKNTYFSIGKTSLFFKKDPVYSETKFGPIVLFNKISPTSGNAIANSEHNAVKKSLSEAVERRILMQPIIKKQMYKSYDLITGSSKWINWKSLGYGSSVDSTGTASHTDVKLAIIHSLEELLEKNVLIRIWYKKEAYNISQFGWKPDYPYSKNTIFLINTFFLPFVTVVSACKDKNGYWHCGLSCTLNDVNKAKRASFQEMKLLWNQDTIYEPYADNYDYVKKHINLFTYYTWSQNQKLHMESLVKNAPVYHKKIDFGYKTMTLSSIGMELSKKINHLNIVFLADSLLKGTDFSVRCVSDELISSVPTKRVCEEKIRNKKLKFVTLKEIREHSECPIL
ncbi:hypothetical protein GYM68_09005 [Lactobacillus panisapium]|uniref:YcaO-like family protein n=1 Tax=Lactobacillus panisapium TaxID=2012495 RepID=UPI001C6A5343|nr:YcaO-like family protein [Lactobacillus panisapium]QYN59367.1 hypothetical protein GYM68_09005 [Lactobacillus panisapium]